MDQLNPSVRSKLGPRPKPTWRRSPRRYYAWIQSGKKVGEGLPDLLCSKSCKRPLRGKYRSCVTTSRMIVSEYSDSNCWRVRHPAWSVRDSSKWARSVVSEAFGSPSEQRLAHQLGADCQISHILLPLNTRSPPAIHTSRNWRLCWPVEVIVEPPSNPLATSREYGHQSRNTFRRVSGPQTPSAVAGYCAVRRRS